jgi:ribosomal protein S15
VAVLSERIATLRGHVKERRSDVHSRKALTRLEERRRGLMKYMRRHNVVSYEMMMKECGMREDEIDGQGRTDKSGNQARRVPRSG